MPTKRGSGFGLTMAGIVSGLLLGLLINQLLSVSFSKEQLISFGWRIPFIFGGVVCLVSYKIRKSLQETKAFQKITHHVKHPVTFMLKNYAWQVLGGVIITGVLGAIIVTNIVFMPTYLIKIVHIKAVEVNLAILVAMALYVFMTYMVGRINNHLAVKPLLIVGLVIDLGLIMIGYWLLANDLYLQIALVLLAVSVAVPTVCVPHLLSLMFPVQVRLSGVALAYNIGFGIFGGMVPIVITYFIKSGGNIFMVPVVFLGLIILVGLVAVRFISQSKDN
jgi:MFS family permease